jgi:hypothetical protein
LQVLGTALGLGYVFVVTDLKTLSNVASSIPVFVPLTMALLTLLNVGVGTLRWKVALIAYGADVTPPLSRLYYVYLVSLFYNTYLPGGLGGDFIRGLVARESFGVAGVTRSLTVVFVERVMGLGGLLIVASTVLFLHPLPGLQSAPLWGAVGLAVALATVIAIAMGRRLSSLVPGFGGRFLARLPPLTRPVGLAVGLALSLLTHLITAVAGYLVLSTVDPSVGLLDAIVVVPVATAAAFFPLTVGGAGAREAAFVVLCSLALHMDPADAAASSLVIFAVQLVVAAGAGALQLLIPLERPESSGVD